MCAEGSKEGVADVNAYEEQRRMRIAENWAKLHRLGLLESVAELGKSSMTVLRGNSCPVKRPSAANNRTNALHPRRSARLRQNFPKGITSSPTGVAELQSSKDAVYSLTQQRTKTCGPPLNGAANSASLATTSAVYTELNQHRVLTMSTAALRTRICKIRNVPKMQNFIEELLSSNMPDLAREATAALDCLTARQAAPGPTR